jgi:hypothetical protein
MDRTATRSLRVGAAHLAKLAVDLTSAVHTLAEQDLAGPSGRARWDVEMVGVTVDIEGIRKELDLIEAGLASMQAAQAEAA